MAFLGWLTGQDAIEDAQDQASRDQQAYLEELRRIYSRENIYSPEQLQTQEALFPFYQAMLGQATGVSTGFGEGDGPLPEADWAGAKQEQYAATHPQLSFTPEEELKNFLFDLMDQSFSVSNKDRVMQNPTYAIKQGIINQQQKEKADYEAGLPEGYTKYADAFTAGQEMYTSGREAEENRLTAQKGAEQSALDVGINNAYEHLRRENRALMGGGVSGHITGQMGELAEASIPMRQGLERDYNLRMDDWRIGQANTALQGLTGMAFGQPAGNRPYMPPTPAPAYADTTQSNLFNSLGSLGAQYVMGKIPGIMGGTPYPNPDIYGQLGSSW